MSNRGRFGKYGEIKRFERLRKRFDLKFLPKREAFANKPSKGISLVVRIEDAREQDSTFIKELSEILFSEYGEYGNYLPSFLARDKARVWIATQGKSKVGFLIVAPYEDSLDSFEIVAVAVAPKYQGRGIGKLLLDLALKSLKEAKVQKIVAHVARGNNASFNLFTSKGFLPVSIKEGFYRSQDAIMLVKRINTKGENHEENNR